MKTAAKKRSAWERFKELLDGLFGRNKRPQPTASMTQQSRKLVGYDMRGRRPIPIYE